MFRIIDSIRPNTGEKSPPATSEKPVQGEDSDGTETEKDDSPSEVPRPPPVSDMQFSQLDEYVQYALQKINEDRQEFGLDPVKLSENEAAQKHAEEMLQTRQLSHWTTDGMKPYMRYSVYDGIGYVAQNAAGQYSFSSDPISEARIEACKKGIAFCFPTDIKNAIKEAEHDMMYDDLECCANGHKDNILDPHHTHVSIGIAYDGVDFFMVQNFENQHIAWDNPMTYDESSDTISMKGTLDREIRLDVINMFYDPFPTQQAYEDNIDAGAYGLGDLVAVVVEPAPFGSFYEDSEGPILVEAKYWRLDQDPNSFEISFSLDKVSTQYGAGVYTVLIWGLNEDSESLPITNISVLRK
jgi:uncharacterized protein YkwD